jgi:hypothetical protein
MRTQVWLGFAIVAAAPVLLAISYISGMIVNLTSAVEGVIVVIVAAMLISGCSLIWNGRKPDEQANQRKEDIWKAIKEWVELPSTGFGGQPDPLPLAEKPPNLAVEIEDCLNRNYPSIWANMREFRRVHAELVAIRKNPQEFWEKIDGRMTLHYGLLLARENSIHHQLAQMQRELIQQLKSEILEKHYTRLKC